MASDVQFYPITITELQQLQQRGVNPKHRAYACGACGQSTNGRVVASTKRESDGANLWWCVCSCEKEEPTLIIERGGAVVSQVPEAPEFQPGEKWPPELEQLFDEASKAYAAGAFTATAMVCRKILMACACHEGDADGKAFAQYVDYITGTVLTFPKAKDAIDKIRNIGNDANHKVRFVSRDDAKRALSIVTYMLTTIYSLPSA
jgi:hypothetical protein